MAQIPIATAQNVQIVFNAASVLERIWASLIDWAIKIAYAIVIFYVVFYQFGINEYIDGLDRMSESAIYTIAIIPIMVYSLLLEILLDGQTFGKKLIKIKVVKIDGYEAGFGEYFMRWLFRLIDLMILNGLIAVITCTATKYTQRIGDLAAGTAVITLKNKIGISHTILQDVESDYVPLYPQVIRLSDNDVRIIMENFKNAVQFNDLEKMGKIASKIEEVIKVKNASAPGPFIRTILLDYNYYTGMM